MSRTIKQYSLAFQQKVGSEIESGELSIEDACYVYKIDAKMIVLNRLKKLYSVQSSNNLVYIKNLLKIVEHHVLKFFLLFNSTFALWR